MKKDINQNYVQTTIVCACGQTFQTGSTKENIHVELCSNCHPFYTGKQKIVDSAGRVERFKGLISKKAKISKNKGKKKTDGKDSGSKDESTEKKMKELKNKLVKKTAK